MAEPVLDSCGVNPYLVTSAFVRHSYWRPDPWKDYRTVVATRDTVPDDRALQVTLATERQTGTVHGLAVDWRDGTIFAAAYFKARTAFGPGGPGAIYRLDPVSRSVETWSVLDAGTDPHDHAARDKEGARWVGRVGLGDLELSTDGRTLFATNLHDRRIYAISVSERTIMTSFPHGASTEPWAANARPFGLAFHRGWLYHGVIDSREDPELPGSLSAHVYRSRANGSGLTEVASFDLGYPRTPAWQPWQDDVAVDLERRSQPMLTDLGVRANGDIVVAFTDRLRDVMAWVHAYGDLLLLRHEPPLLWHAMTDPTYFEDGFWSPESYLGGLTMLPGSDTMVTTAMWGPFGYGGLYWLDNATGRRDQTIDGRELLFADEFEVGDVEAYCQPQDSQVYLPIALRDACLSEAPLDVILVLDMSTSMRQPAEDGRAKHEAVTEAARGFALALLGDDALHRMTVVGFNDSAWREQAWSGQSAEIEAAIQRLPQRIAEGTRLDLALEEATAVALGPERRPAAEFVTILLTDGMPNRVPAAPDGSQRTTVLQRAASLKTAGSHITTIGYGRSEQLDETLLRGVASRPEDYLHAPGSRELDALYARLAARVRCGRG